MMSLWVEALCIHEWCLFTERIEQDPGVRADRGHIYQLLTARPDNRRPLSWERNNIDLLLMDGKHFVCPWTERHIDHRAQYAIDHLIPISVYPINELWNLLPCDPAFNSHIKRDRLPSLMRLSRAEPHIKRAYANYESSEPLALAIHEDAALRFTSVTHSAREFSSSLASAVVSFADQLADVRNLSRFK